MLLCSSFAPTVRKREAWPPGLPPLLLPLLGGEPLGHPSWAQPPGFPVPLGKPCGRSRAVGEKGQIGSRLSPPPPGFSAAETTIGAALWEKTGGGEERQEPIWPFSPTA